LFRFFFFLFEIFTRHSLLGGSGYIYIGRRAETTFLWWEFVFRARLKVCTFGRFGFCWVWVWYTWTQGESDGLLLRVRADVGFETIRNFAGRVELDILVAVCLQLFQQFENGFVVLPGI
jgi:hypothetical protein